MKDIAQILNSYSFAFCNEGELQEALAEVFAAEGIAFSREVPLSAADRIDFLIGDTGVEVKVGFSYSDVIRQLHRYAQCDEIKSLYLVTSRMSHVMPSEINGKVLTTVNIGLNSSL
jgi:hypothetical protein